MFWSDPHVDLAMRTEVLKWPEVCLQYINKFEELNSNETFSFMGTYQGRMCQQLCLLSNPVGALCCLCMSGTK